MIDKLYGEADDTDVRVEKRGDAQYPAHIAMKPLTERLKSRR